MSLKPNIESILFVASKPLTIKEIARALKADLALVEETVHTICALYNRADSGIHVLFQDGTVQMATNPDCHEATELFIKDEIAGELTKAQLETLTVIAYKGPVTRPELEQIRGVNCAMILRNLMIRGLVEEEERAETLVPVYLLSTEALRHLGIHGSHELPQFDVLSQHAHVMKEQK